nr:GatB/YqeY domain-containing protein [Bacteroidales bacterium]
DIKVAMRAKDKVALTAIRGLKKEFLEAQTAKGSNGELTDEVAVKMVQKLVTQRKDSAELFIAQDREDLAENEIAEADILKKYLPQQLTSEELEAAVKAIIVSTGADGMKDMGKVMGMASKQLAGKAEGRDISTKVKALLA